MARNSVPYFEGATGDQPAVQYTYDAIGRVVRVKYPDDSIVSSCYDKGVKVVIDANGHFKRSTTNTQGKVVKVEEYLGTLSSCTTNMADTAYSTTSYVYDVLGNLVSVTDDNGNQTQVQYDALGRKTSMTDPDMGVWHYGYDANGNLIMQADAKGQTIRFSYDPLNRVNTKTYPDNTLVTYTYDVKPDTSTTTTYPVGRLSIMSDVSGTTMYFYDNMGRTATTKKTIDGTIYTIASTYDNGGRLSTLQYPDGDLVGYEYDSGGNLSKVKNINNNLYGAWQSDSCSNLYDPSTVCPETEIDNCNSDTENPYTCPANTMKVCNDVANIHFDAGSDIEYWNYRTATCGVPYVSYENFDQLEQPGKATYSNGVNTIYEYNTLNGRLTSLLTSGPTGSSFLNLSYHYDLQGNITELDDSINSSRSQWFIYDDVNRLQQAQSNSYGVQFFAYDQIGNLLYKSGDNTCPAGYTFLEGTCERGSYTSWQSGYCDAWSNSCWDNSTDTCDGNSGAEYVCQAGVEKTCNDVTNYVVSGTEDNTNWNYRTVTCSSTTVPVNCPAGSTYNTATKSCETTPACTQGTYDASLDSCATTTTSGPTCPSGTSLDTATDRCEAAPGCPAGYTLSGDECMSATGWQSVSCDAYSPSSCWNTQSDTCDSNNQTAYSCPSGVTKNCRDVTGWLFVDDDEGGVTYWSYRSESCQPVGSGCPTGTTLNTTTNLCEAAPGCSVGSYDPALNLCVSGAGCPSGTLLDTATHLCEAAPGCPAGYTLSGDECMSSTGWQSVSCDAYSPSSCWNTQSDTCDGNNQTAYSCPSGVTKNCRDVSGWYWVDDSEGGVTYWSYRSESCQPASGGCPSGTTLNTATNLCEAVPTSSVAAICPAGFTLDPATDRCQAAPVCEAGSTFDPSKDSCTINQQNNQYVYGGQPNAGPHAVVSTPDGRSYTYEPNGNMISDGQRTITYNYDNLPSSITINGSTTTFVYDGNGNRVKKITPSGATIYIGKLYECTMGASCSKYIFAGGTRIAHKTSAGDVVYYHGDHLGSTRIVTDSSGTLCVNIDETPPL